MPRVNITGAVTEEINFVFSSTFTKGTNILCDNCIAIMHYLTIFTILFIFMKNWNPSNNSGSYVTGLSLNNNIKYFVRKQHFIEKKDSVKNYTCCGHKFFKSMIKIIDQYHASIQPPYWFYMTSLIIKWNNMLCYPHYCKKRYKLQTTIEVMGDYYYLPQLHLYYCN